MRAWRSAALLVSTALTVGALSACGGSGSSTSSTNTKKAPGTVAANITIKKDWTAFFNGSTPTSKRLSLLQHGQRYKPALIAQSKSALAQQSSAKVTGVTLHGPSSATVDYSILVGGQPALKHQTGTAVKSGDTWKVSDKSFCRLLSLQGKPPQACPKA